MHRVVHILFVLCLVPVSEQSASIGPQAENYSKLNVIHSMRRDAGRGKPDSPKQLPPGLSHGLLSAARHGALALLWQVQAQTSQQPGARAQLAAALSSDEFRCLEALLTSNERVFNDVSGVGHRRHLESWTVSAGGSRALPPGG